MKRLEKVAQLRFSQNEKNDRADRLGKANAPKGQILIQQALHDVGAHSDFHTVQNLLEGFCP